MRIIFVALASTVLMSGCCETCRNDHIGGELRSFGKREAEVSTRGLVSVTGDLDVDAKSPEPHYAGDGHGGIEFKYWIIHYRASSASCFFLSTVNATTYSSDNVGHTCGVDNTVYYRIHVNNPDIVP